MKHNVDLLSVYIENDVAFLKNVLIRCGIANAHDVRKQLTVCGKIYRYNDDCAQKVHKRARKQHYKALPSLLIVECVGVFYDISVFVFNLISVFVNHCAFGVLAVKSAKSAYGKRTKRKQFARLFIAFFDDCRSETYCELVDFESEQFAGGVMSEFVYDNHCHKRKNGYDDVSDICENFACRCAN